MRVPRFPIRRKREWSQSASHVSRGGRPYTCYHHDYLGWVVTKDLRENIGISEEEESRSESSEDDVNTATKCRLYQTQESSHHRSRPSGWSLTRIVRPPLASPKSSALSDSSCIPASSHLAFSILVRSGRRSSKRWFNTI